MIFLKNISKIYRIIFCFSIDKLIIAHAQGDGVFHAHPEFHTIKKESIGLIEAQGLFILPGRLVKELGEVGNCIVNDVALPEALSQFDTVYAEIKALCNGDLSKENVSRATREELGSVCARILENTAVFKDDRLTIEFLKELGFV